MARRIKLFSKNTVRRKLFCDEQEETKVVVCSDCGFKMKTAADTTNLICPKCGGNRFNVERVFYSPAGTPEPVKTTKRVGLFSTLAGEEESFQKTFSETTDELELKLKEYSGQTMSEKDVEKKFSITAEELIEKGFAEHGAGSDIRILDTAFLQSRLFSKLIMQITKVFEIEPKIISTPLPDKESIIEGLEDKIGSKGVIILKKSHGFPIEKEENSWASDSGITNDLPLEFGGQIKTEPELLGIMKDRYPDAPEHILDILKAKGIIKPCENGKIEIIK